MITVNELMSRDVFTAERSQKILEVRKIMLEQKISRVVIVNQKGKPVGIITDKDILRYATKDTSGRDLDDLKAEELMSHPLITIEESISVQKASKKMLEIGTSSLVVVDKDENLVGIVTKTDLCAYIALSMRGRYLVEQFMSKPPITIKPSQTIAYAAYLMETNKISRLIVVDGNIEGILTLSDMVGISPFISKMKTSTGSSVVIEKGMIVPREYIHLLTVGDFMTRHPITIEARGDLADAAKLMLMHRISGLPVVDKKRKLVGVITKTDLVKALAFS